MSQKNSDSIVILDQDLVILATISLVDGRLLLVPTAETSPPARLVNIVDDANSQGVSGATYSEGLKGRKALMHRLESNDPAFLTAVCQEVKGAGFNAVLVGQSQKRIIETHFPKLDAKLKREHLAELANMPQAAADQLLEILTSLGENKKSP